MTLITVIFIKCMAKKSTIEKEKKRESLVKKYYAIRTSLKSEMSKASSVEDRFSLQAQLQKLPRNSAPSRRF